MEKQAAGVSLTTRKTAEDEDGDDLENGGSSEEARCHAPFPAKDELF